MGTAGPRPLTLDAGALIALERRSNRMRSLLRAALSSGARMYVPAGALAQAWRGGQRQAVVASLLARDSVRVVPLDETYARAAGELCAKSGSPDVVDASVVLCARITGSTVISSDPDDLRRFDPRLRVETV